MSVHRDRFRRFLLLVFGMVFFFVNGFVSATGNEMKIEGVSISPDGNSIVFKYGQQGFRSGLGLLELRTGKLTAIPTPNGNSFGDASFSEDGKSLLTSTFGSGGDHLASIDLATLDITKLAQIPPMWMAPVRLPSESKVLFVVNSAYGHHLGLLDLKTNEATIVLEQKLGFSHLISKPYFVGKNEVIFTGMGAMEPELKQKTESLGIDQFATIACRLRFGGMPELILEDQSRQNKSMGTSGISTVSASRDGQTLAYIGLSKVKPKNVEGAYNWEIFTARDGIVTQATDLQSYLGLAEISMDGSSVVFGLASNLRTRSNPRLGNLVPHVLDLRTGRVTRIKLAEMLQQRPDFSLPQTKSNTISGK